MPPSFNIQTVTLIFSQIDKNKIQSRPPIGHLLFTFPLLLKYKTDFPVKIYHNASQLEQCARSFAAIFFEREMLHGCGLVRTTWRSVDRLDRTRKERSFTILNIEQRSIGYISSPKGRDKRRYKVDLKHLAVL